MFLAKAVAAALGTLDAMYTHENFAADVARNFGFLETEYGMRREPPNVAGVGSWVVYANALMKVVVEHEVGGYCGVSVVNLRHVKHDPMERSEFDLEEIIAVGGPRQTRRQDPRSMSEAVQKSAETLRTVGASVLKGDFEALHARQRRNVEAARRNNPLSSN
ncbi:MAG TPA: hypothetical protein VN380_15445 [Thermoanaerobaculia bacterium]|jgi:hypothetical protein|nr:hypothetical protein [Thermoanaerobaculia bacterium]